MLHQKFSLRCSKQLLVLPLVAILFAATAQAQQPSPRPAAPENAPVRTLFQEPNQQPDKVYTYVEQMPALPGGGGNRAIVAAIQERVVYPKVDAVTQLEGRVFVSFIVGSTGQVQDIKVVKGLSPAYDNAVVNAVQQLPTFKPGQQKGRPVAVSFTVPVSFNTAKEAEKKQ